MYKDAKIFFENHLNPVKVVFIGKLSRNTQMSTHVPGFQGLPGASSYLDGGWGMVLASRASGCLLDTQTLEKNPSGHPKDFVWNF